MLRTIQLAALRLSRPGDFVLAARGLSTAAVSGGKSAEGAEAVTNTEAAAAATSPVSDDVVSSQAENDSKSRPRVPEYIKPWQKKWFPNERILLVKPEELDVSCTELVFRVPPHMTKHEIKDYLQAVYGFDVKNVNTVNRLGKVKYPAGYSLVRHKAYRRPDFKQAYVTLNSPDLLQQPSNQVVRNIPEEGRTKQE